MTSPRSRPKPAVLKLTYARAELLNMAMIDQRQALRRTLRLQEANPHQNAQEKYEIEQTRTQLKTCGELITELVAAQTELLE